MGLLGARFASLAWLFAALFSSAGAVEVGGSSDGSVCHDGYGGAGQRQCMSKETAMIQKQQRVGRLAPQCASPWEQCGGKNQGTGEPWSGAGCCTEGYACEKKDDWYSQCKPADTSGSQCTQPWKQCGGAGYAGPSCCTPGYACEFGSEHWSMCVPTYQSPDAPESLPPPDTVTTVGTMAPSLPPTTAEPTPTISTTSANEETSRAGESCAAPHKQCGGKVQGGLPWDGPTCCTVGYACTKKSDWWSKCAPVNTTSSDCAQPWRQCGGGAWAGSTCCTAGYACTKQDDWWSSCKPTFSAPTPPPELKPAPQPTSAPVSGPAPTPMPAPSPAPTTPPATVQPAPAPTLAPSPAPTLPPATVQPAPAPTLAPSPAPTMPPATARPTAAPTRAPSPASTTTLAPTEPPTAEPTAAPTQGPSPQPTPAPAEVTWQGENLHLTHYWDCSGQGCDAATLQPWDESKYVSPPGYGPQDPNDFGGAAYGETMWLTGAASDALSALMGPDDGCCGTDPNDGGVGGCGKCILLQNPDSLHPDWTAVVMKKNRCPPWSNGCGEGMPHLDIAAPGFDNLQYSTANVCGKRPGTGFESQMASEAMGRWYESCQNTAECIDRCLELEPGMRKGCQLFANWGWKRGDPKNVKYTAVECPAAFVNHVGSLFGPTGPQEAPAPAGPEPTSAPTPATAPTDAPTPAASTAAPTPSGTSFRGTLTMWSTQSALIGSQCEYANAPVNSLTDPVMPSYLRSGFHCAIGNSNPGFGKGEHCGTCYKLTSLSDDGVSGTPGSRGSAVVMVSNGGAGGDGHFDCILDSFKEITGAETGIFDVEFQQVPCEDVTGGPVVINWADQNAYYCKMMFENIGGWGQLESVKACLDGSCKQLEQFSGATWTGCPTGTSDRMTFELTQRGPSGRTATVSCECAGSWPWPTGKRCACPANFEVEATA